MVSSNITRRALVASLVMMIGSAVTSWADPIRVFRTRSAFDAAIGPAVFEPFPTATCFSIGPRLSADTGVPCAGDYPIQRGITYSTNPEPNSSFVGLNLDAEGGFEGAFLDTVNSATGGAPLTVVFDAPVAGFGFDTNLFMGTEFSITFRQDAGAFTARFPVDRSPRMQFFGFQSAAANIREVVIDGNHRTFGFVIDNVAFGGHADAPVVPEPATLSLLVGAGAALFVRRRRRPAASD